MQLPILILILIITTTIIIVVIIRILTLEVAITLRHKSTGGRTFIMLHSLPLTGNSTIWWSAILRIIINLLFSRTLRYFVCKFPSYSRIKSCRCPINIFKKLFKESNRSAHCLGLSARIFLTLQTSKAQKIENRSVQLVLICLSAALVGTGQPFLSQECGKSDFLELLCMRCEAFMGILR